MERGNLVGQIWHFKSRAFSFRLAEMTDGTWHMLNHRRKLVGQTVDRAWANLRKMKSGSRGWPMVTAEGAPVSFME